jgi:hypothetical protein
VSARKAAAAARAGAAAAAAADDAGVSSGASVAQAVAAATAAVAQQVAVESALLEQRLASERAAAESAVREKQAAVMANSSNSSSSGVLLEAEAARVLSELAQEENALKAALVQQRAEQVRCSCSHWLCIVTSE